MTISGTNVASKFDFNDAASYSTASYTPTANRLLVAYVENSLATTPTTPTLSGNGLTWDQLVTYLPDVTGTQLRMTIFVAKSGSSPSAGAVTADFGGVTQLGCSIHVDQFDGADLSGTALAAIAQNKTGSTSGSGTSETITLNAAIGAGNATYGAIEHQTNEASTPGSGYTTLLSNNRGGSPASASITEYRADGQQVVDGSWATTVQKGGIALEIKAAGGGGGGSPPSVGAPAFVPSRRLARVVFEIDDSVIDLQGWSFSSVVNGGYDQLRGQAKTARLRALDAGQGVPITAYHGETGDVLYDGRFVTDPHVEGGVASIAGTGAKAALEKAKGHLMFMNRDPSKWFDRAGPPLNNPESQILGLSLGDHFLWRESQGSAASTNDHRSICFWSPDSRITRMTFRHRGSATGSRQYEIYTTDAWPTDSGYFNVINFGEVGSETFRDIGDLDQPGAKGIIIQRKYVGGASIYAEGYAQVWDITVYGIGGGGTRFVHQIIAHVAQLVGFETDLASSGIDVLPLDWESGSHAELLSYVTSLADWRWLVRTQAESGKGLIRYIEAGPWEEEWTLHRATARPTLTPLEIFNKGIIHFTDQSGTKRQAERRADPNPLEGLDDNVWEDTLADVQPNENLAETVLAALVPRHAAKRWTGEFDAIEARDEAGRGDARLIPPGVFARLADWGPNEDSVHRIHGVEQTPTGVRCSTEAPISGLPITGPAGLAAARMAVTPEVPELAPPEAVEPEIVEPLGPTEAREQLIEEMAPRQEALAALGNHPHHAQWHRHVGAGGHKHHGERHIHL